MNWHRVGLTLSLLLMAVAGVFAQAPSARAATHNVSLQDDPTVGGVFTPKAVTVSVGDTVQWDWAAGNVNSHSVTADDASFDSNPPSGSRMTGTYAFTFNTPGTYAYYCRIHGAPGGQGMSGTVVVQAAAAPTSTSTQPAASSTPITPTVTPISGTPISTDTPAPVLTTTVPPIAAASPAAPAQPDAGTGAATQLPSAGTGEDRANTPADAAIVLALLGTVALSAALVARRRA